MMEFPTYLFSFTLLVSALLVGMLSIYIGTTIRELTKSVVLTMWCATIWGFFYGLELISHTLPLKILFLDLQYIGISFISSFWVLFAIHYTSYKSKKFNLILVALFTIPVVTLILVLTSPYQHFFYESISIVQEDNFTNLVLVKAPWYYVQVAYSYASFMLGLIILWRRFRHSNPLYKTQTKQIILAGSIPIVFNMLYQSGIYRPFDTIDLTPFSFLLSFGIVGLSIARHNLFNIKPIAQNKIIEALTRGVLVLNAKSEIVDYNSEMKSFLDDSTQMITGAFGPDLFSNHSEIQKLMLSSGEKNIGYELETIGKKKNIQVEKIDLKEEQRTIGTIFLFEDTTEQIEINKKLKFQAEELQSLNNLKDKYFSIISHDLKGPVYGIKELIHLTNTGLVSQEEFMEMLPEVSRNMEQVAMLLDNLLAWSSSQLKGGETVNTQEFDIHKVLIQQKGILERVAAEKQLDITIDDQAKSLVNGDKNMIELVIRNLINNAIKFSSNGSIISLTTVDEQDYVKICIEDNGKGI
ncbi:MAG: histidine kinase N-terminal 7TM domain-containing protein, partial [Algoriphagus sp.]